MLSEEDFKELDKVCVALLEDFSEFSSEEIEEWAKKRGFYE